MCQTGKGRLARTRQSGIPDRRESARAVPINAAPWRSAAKPVGDDSPRTQPVSAIGLLLCLLAGLSYAAYALVNKRLVSAAAPALP